MCTCLVRVLSVGVSEGRAVCDADYMTTCVGALCGSACGFAYFLGTHLTLLLIEPVSGEMAETSVRPSRGPMKGTLKEHHV